MTKYVMKAAGILAMAFAWCAGAQDPDPVPSWTVKVDFAVPPEAATSTLASALAVTREKGKIATYAAEIFKGGTYKEEVVLPVSDVVDRTGEVVEKDVPTRIILTLNAPGMYIPGTESAVLRFRLVGEKGAAGGVPAPQFSARVSAGDLKHRDDPGKATPAILDWNVLRGTGEKEDTFVEFELEGKNEDGIVMYDGESIAFTLEEFQNAGQLANPGAQVCVETTVEQTSGGRVDPTKNLVDVDGTDYKPVKFPVIVDKKDCIATSVDALGLSVVNGTNRLIDIDDRTKLVGLFPAVDKTQSLHIATLDARVSYGAANDPVLLDKEGDALDDRDMAGKVTIAVGGQFQAGDKVVLDIDGDGAADRDELFDVSAEGMVDMEDFDLADAKGAKLYFVPGGEKPMRPARYEATYSFTYTSTHLSGTGERVTPAKGMASLSYSGIVSDTYAYAIPPRGAAETANLRLTCEGINPCTVYFDCHDRRASEGKETDLFAKRDDAIPGNSSLRLDQAGIAAVLAGTDELVDGNWEGRMSCNIYSNNSVTSQLLVRDGSDGVLRNNTFVANKTNLLVQDK